MRKVLIIWMLTGFITLANAQVSGYMGKRFSIHYTFAFFPNVFGFEGRDVPVYMQQVGYLSYVINRHISIEGGYGFHRSPMNLQVTIYGTDIYGNQTQRVIPGTASATINEGFVNIKMFQRRRGYFPPLGRYGKFGIGIAHINATSYGNSNFVGETLPSYNDVILRIGLGRQFVVANRLTIDYGFDVGLPLVSIFRSINNTAQNYDGNTVYTQDDVTAAQKTISVYLMQLHVGIGFLAF